ncbi:hypothetical protein [Lusitaniella coriacea]|uniref:hypothetical protein n=1 Tax=Lusitaniella coriacea TaxID=1983105 RepID=UPI003CE6E5EB
MFNLIVLITALLIAWLVFTGLVNILKASVKTALSVAVIVLVAQIVLGVRPQELWQQLVQFGQILQQLFFGNG